MVTGAVFVSSGIVWILIAIVLLANASWIDLYVGRNAIWIELRCALVAALLVLLVALRSYRRQYSRAMNDLTHGSLALILMDDTYGLAIEQAARERFRPSPLPVRLGRDFASRVNHLAHYYEQYCRLARGPTKIAVPCTCQLSCWIEGCLIAYGGSMLLAMLPAYEFLSLAPTPGISPLHPVLAILFSFPLLAVPLIPRIALLWPSILATKQTVVDYFGGRYDYLLEPPPGLPPPPATPPPPTARIA
jgi:hypothetical protein